MTTQSDKFRALAETLDKRTEAEFEVPLKSVVKQPKPGPKKPQLA
jgi:hypothetical protein